MIVCVQILVGFNSNEPEDYYDSKTKLSIISLSYRIKVLKKFPTSLKSMASYV